MSIVCWIPCLLSHVPVSDRAKLPYKSLRAIAEPKGMYYYGVKLNALGFRRSGRLPHPEQIVISKASENDLTVYKDNWSELRNRTFFGDKIYQNEDFFEKVRRNFNSEILTPVKYHKGVPDQVKRFNKAADDLYSRAVSKIRQPRRNLQLDDPKKRYPKR